MAVVFDFVFWVEWVCVFSYLLTKINCEFHKGKDYLLSPMHFQTYNCAVKKSRGLNKWLLNGFFWPFFKLVPNFHFCSLPKTYQGSLEAQMVKKVKAKSLSRVQLLVTPGTAAHQAPPSMGFSRQKYWSRVPFPSPGDVPNTGIEPRSPTLQADSLSSEPMIP